MVRVRIAKSPKQPVKRPAPPKPDPFPVTPDQAPPRTGRGLTERQWFIGLLVASGLLLLFTFRGCILPTGIAPEGRPAETGTATPAATTAPAPGGEYTVEPGDTLSSIAQKTGTTVEALAQANGIDLNQRVILRVGQKLKLPSS